MTKDSTIILKIEDETKELLIAAAKRERVSLSELVRRIIEQSAAARKTGDRRQVGRILVIKYIKDRRVANCKEE